MAKKASELHKKWLDDPDYRAEYEALAEELELAGALIHIDEKFRAPRII